MSSAWRNGLAAVVLLAATSAALMAQDGRGYGRGRRASVVIDPSHKVDYDGRFAFVRLRYGGLAGAFSRREPPWAHDYPRADFHFLKILGEITLTRTYVDEGNILREKSDEHRNDRERSRRGHRRADVAG